MTQLETVPNTGKATRTSFSLLSRPLVVFVAATVFLALPAIAFAQAAKPRQEKQDAIKRRVAKINLSQRENTNNQTSTAAQLESVPSTAADAIRPFHVNIPKAALVDLRRRLAGICDRCYRRC